MMLRSLWQKLSGKQANTAAAPQKAAPQALSLVTPGSHDHDDHYSPLWNLLNQRQLLEVKLQGSNTSYQTLIVAIDIQRGLLWLDDLFPNQYLLNIGDTLTLRHHRHGEQLYFNAPLVAWGNQYGAQGLAVLLPEQLTYSPRRQNRRADVRHLTNMTANIRPLGQETSLGYLQDISAGGIRLNVAGNLLGQLRHGALLPLCELRLSDELHIRCSARVRAFRLIRTSGRYTQISLEFQDLLPERRQQLEQFVNNLHYLHERQTAVQLRSA